MKKIERYRFGLVAVLAVVIVCAGIFTACAEEKEPDKREIWCQIGYARGYDSLEELAENSDKIAVVKVMDEKFEEQVIGNYSTINHLKVVRPVYNCEKGEEITFQTPSGIKDGVFYQSNHTTLLEKGKTYLLYMQKVEDGVYASFCGDDGRFLVEDGKVTSTHHESVRSKWEDGSTGTAHIVNQDLEEVIGK